LYPFIKYTIAGKIVKGALKEYGSIEYSCKAYSMEYHVYDSGSILTVSFIV